MAISTSKTEIYAEGTTDISWTRLQNNLGSQQQTNIRFGVYKRTPEDSSEEPLIPDAEENANIGTEESGNLRVSAFRGAIKRHDVTFDSADEYQNEQFDKYFGANLVKNVPKQLNIDGIVYSYDVDEPAAKIESDSSVRNLTVDVSTTGAIYGAGADATTESQGIAGGTALYVDSGTNSRNFKINLESTGGSFGKIYGGGGGGVTGSPGAANNSSCTRNEDNSVSTYVPATCVAYGTYQPIPSTQRSGPTYIPSGGNNGAHPQDAHGIELARSWDQRAESWCRSTYGGNSFGGHPTGGRGYGQGYGFIGDRGGHPYFVEHSWSFYCTRGARYNPAYPGTQYSYSYDCSYTSTQPRSRGASGTITSPGGTGGPGGKGQSYQRAFTAGTTGSPATQVECTSLGDLYTGPATTGLIGKDGTTGGNWGQSGGDSQVATGGLAGYAIQKSDSSIDINVIGGDENRLKGREN